jgi:hypothetical protein
MNSVWAEFGFKKGLTVWMLVSFLAGSVQAAYNISIQAGSGSTNMNEAAGVFSPTNTPASVGADMLISRFNALGAFELNTGTSGAESGDITSSNGSIAGTNNLATPGTFSINAAGQINLEIRP